MLLTYEKLSHFSPTFFPNKVVPSEKAYFELIVM